MSRKKEFKDNLHDIRKAKKISQKNLAREIGVSVSTIQGYEYGDFKPKYETIIKIAKCLDVRPEDLDEDLKPLAFDSPAAYENAYTQITGNAHPGIPSIESQLETVFPRLNEEGIKKIMEYANDLLGNVKYRRD